MKKNITKEQWDELDLNEKEKLYSLFNILYKDWCHWWSMNIGEMIEFLENNIYEINPCNAGWQVKFDPTIEDNIQTINKATEKELCNALWEAVKYKLKKVA